MGTTKTMAVAALSLTLVSGCAQLNTTQKGALGGGALGAGAGALIGRQSGHTAGGAAIGGALGALTGGVIGYNLQQGEERQAAQSAELSRQRREINKLKAQQRSTSSSSSSRSDDRY